MLIGGFNVSLGQTARRLLGDRYSRKLGRLYRAVFVDLGKVASVVAREIPRDGVVLDVGSGDGEPLNHLLSLRPDIRVEAIDVTPSFGAWIDRRFSSRVTLHPNTTLGQFLAERHDAPDVILLADVVHHIPPFVRDDFFGGVAKFLERSTTLRLIIKDVEPGHWKAMLGYLSDRYVTGDRGVAPIGRTELAHLVTRVCGDLRRRELPLFEQDPPNYALVFER